MVRLGIIGSGRIAQRFVEELGCIGGIEAVMVCNPHSGSAERFAERWGILEHTQSPEELKHRVDAVYIASPHETHYSYAKDMLAAGLHVLCEKPLCFSGAQAAELFELARQGGVVLMEAVKTAYCPAFLRLLEVVGSGTIGEIRDVEACFTRLTENPVREFTDLEYGGSFTEFGSYTLLPVIKLLGKNPCETKFYSLPCENGLDAYTKGIFTYENGMAAVKTGLGVKSEGQLLISGTKGYVLAPSPWWLMKRFEVHFENPMQKEVYEYPFEGQGLRYETEAFVKRIKGEETRGVIGADESIAMAEMMKRFLSGRGETKFSVDRAGR